MKGCVGCCVLALTWLPYATYYQGSGSWTGSEIMAHCVWLAKHYTSELAIMVKVKLKLKVKGKNEKNDFS